MQMEAVDSSRLLVSLYQTTQCYIQEDCNGNTSATSEHYVL